MASSRRARATRTAARLWWLPIVPIGFVTDRGLRPRWLLMPGIVILTALTSSAGKLAIRRPRPGSAARVLPWGHLSAAAFPSTHSACAFAIAGWLRASRHGRWLHAVAVLVGYSRVRCRAHHSTDVVAGAILGYGVALQVERAWSKLVTPRAARGVESGKPRRDRTPAPAGREVSLRPVRRRRGAHLARERRGAKDSHPRVG